MSDCTKKLDHFKYEHIFSNSQNDLAFWTSSETNKCLLKLNLGLLIHLTKAHNALEEISLKKSENPKEMIPKKQTIAKEIACPHCDRKFEKKNHLGNHFRSCGPSTSDKKEELKVTFKEQLRQAYKPRFRIVVNF